MASPGSTYSPGSWYALVSPTAAVFVDPTMPGAQLDALWDGVLAGRGVDEALEVIRGGGRRLPAFAVAAVEGPRVRVVVRGAIQITVQDADGLERGISGAGVEPWREDVVDRAETLWFVRPGGGRDGLALPVVTAAVTADILAWQPDGVARRRGDHDGSTRRMDPLDVRSAPAATNGTGPRRLEPVPRSEAVSRSEPLPVGRSNGVPDGLNGAADPFRGRGDLSSPSAVPSTGVPSPPAPTASPVSPVRSPAPVPSPSPVPPVSTPEALPRDPVPAPVPAPGQGAPIPHAVVMSPPVAAPAPAPVAPAPVPPAPGAPQQVPPAQVPPTVVPPTVLQAASPPAPSSAPFPGPAPAARRYGMLHFSTGEVVDVDGPVVIGRAPAQQDGEQARLVAVKGNGRGISRTHVRVAIDGLGVHVMDLGSRNGTVVKTASGESFALEPGVQHRLLDGQIVSMADVSFEFRAL